jgi:aldose 1-epimerase
MALTGKQFTIRAGEHEVTAVEVGGGLRRYSHAGVDVLASYDEQELPPGASGAVLMPWPNRLARGRYVFDGRSYQVPITEVARGNANHGLARWTRWSPTAIDSAAVTLAVDVVPQTGWPFEIRAEVTYALHPDHGLAVTAVARNHGRSAAPFGAGFHPYLSVRGHQLDEVTLQVPAEQRLVTDEAQLPVGVQPVAKTPYDLRGPRRLQALRLDDAFTTLSTVDGRGAVDVCTPSGGGRLWFDSAFPYLQVFTREHVNGAVPAVAVEPMTCPANAFNSGAGLIVLEPGSMWTGTWGVVPLPR